MSSISLPNEKQIRHFFPFTAVATETTAATFIASASNGELQLFMENGSTTGTGDFYILRKHSVTGVVSKSDLITPKDITYLKGTAPRSKTGKTNVFTITAPVVGATYNLSLKVNYANSEQNFQMFLGSTVAATGENAATVATRIAKQLADNLANSITTSTTITGTDTIISGTTARKNKYFTITVSGTTTATLTITEKDWILDGYVTGLKTFDQLMWNAEVETFTTAAAATVTKTKGTPVYATGQGYQMLELERYLVGHRLEFPGPDITLSFNNQYEIDKTETYYCLDLKYFDVSRNDPYQSDKMLTLVSTDPVELDTIGFRIEELMGGSEGDYWTELDPAQNGADNA
jgi:PHD/YefM family antitoxin component YafN of YafNO toxin-antitoxin module